MVVNIKNTTSIFLSERNEILSSYFADVRKYKVLTSEEEREMLMLYFHGNEKEKDMAMDVLVKSNQRFVISVAKCYGTSDNLLDLINEGNIGLIKAISSYDVENQDVALITHAVYYIRREITNYLKANGEIVKKSNITKTFSLVTKATNDFVQKEHRNPSEEELVEFIEENYDIKLKSCDVLDTSFYRLDEFNQEDKGNGTPSVNNGVLNDYYSNTNHHNDSEKIADSEYNSLLTSTLLDKVDERTSKILKMFYGIGYEYPKTIEEIAQELNLTKERVRQIHKAALSDLKKRFGDMSSLL